MGEQLRGEHQVGGACTVADAEDVGEIERLDHRTRIHREIHEVVSAGVGLVTGAVTPAVERIDRVSRREHARDLVPDLGDEARAVYEKGRRLARIRLAPSGKRHPGPGVLDPNSLPIRHEDALRESSRIIAAPFSAIIAVGVLVLPEVIVGITEASTTRRPARP
jgi:hypothetical protein